MDSRLTDADLIRLVQEKLPEELSHAEIRQLHRRLKESSELKAVLIGQLHLETYLTTALAEINVSVDEIVRKASAMAQPQPAKRWPLWMGLAGLIVAAGVGIYFAVQSKPRDADQLAGIPPKQETPQNEKHPPPENIDKPLETNPAEKFVGPKLPANPPVENKPPEKIAETNPAETPQGKPRDPWFESLNPDAALLPVAETAYRFPGWQRGEPLRKPEAQAWLKPASGHGFSINEKEANNLRWVELDGVGKLQAPWVPDAVLRISLFEDENFNLHFWAGEEGVTLKHYRNRRPQLWSAYRSQRKPNKPLPERLASLLTSDDGRQSRVRSGVVEFRYQEGSLVMSQGHVRLLSVPMPVCPQEIIFDGKIKLSELAMYRGEDFPPAEPNPRPLVRTSKNPVDAAWMTSLPTRDLREGIRELGQTREAQDDWQESLAEGIFVSANAGKIRLAVEKSEQPVFVATRLERAGFYEVIFRVDEAAPGVGFYFGDDKGKELHRIGFLRERRTGQLVFNASRNYNDKEIDRDPKNEPVAYFEPRQWIRVVWGFNSFKVWSSGDGVHWGLALFPTRGFSGPFTSLGLMVQKTDQPLKISLSHLEIRELSAVTSLASETARELVPPMGDLSQMDFGTWNQKVLAARPRDAESNPSISMAEWRRACAIRSLAESPWCSLSSTLLRGLIEEGLQSAKPLSERFRLLDEVSLLYDLWGGAESAAMVEMYERLGTMAAEEGQPDPFGSVITQLQTAPIWTEANMQIIQPDFTREMLLRETYTRDWKQLRSIARRTEFLMLSAHPQQNWWWERDQRSLLDWAEMLANQEAPEPAGETADWMRLASRGRQWKQPLVTQVSKEGYNVMAEFEAALNSDANADACRIITSAGRAGLAGLLPDSKDPDLLVSLPRAIAIAMREHPELQATMCKQFGDIGKVRAREAMTRADVDAVEAATVRFFGTPAAAEAYQWLGDRALAGGKFAQAAQAYQDALPAAENTLKRDLQNRLRLAAGMLGHEVKSEPAATVEIASASWTGPEFERLIEQIRQGHARAESATLADWNSPQAMQSPPQPAHFNAVVRNRFTGDLGKGAGRYEDRNTDWAARQLAVATQGNLMFVSNRFQVVCYRMNDGGTQWSRGLGGEQGDIHAWPFISMQPLAVGDRVFVRRLTKRGPELACFSKNKGEVLWHVRPEHHVASDPVFVQNRLLALVATIPQSGMLQLDLTSFHPESGAVLSQQPLLMLQDEWNGCPPCQILATNGKILATIGGATVCCDSLGQPQWLQKHPWLPAEVDRDSKWQQHQPPLVSEGRVYISQAGVKEIACFELATGRKIWSRPVPHIVRVAGIAGGNLIVQTEMGLKGFDHLTGEPRWSSAIPDMLYGMLCGGDRLVYSRLLESAPEDIVCLVWLNPQTGEELAHSRIKPLEGKDLRFGPLIAEDERLWGFFGRGFKEASRELVRVGSRSRPAARRSAFSQSPGDVGG